MANHFGLQLLTHLRDSINAFGQTFRHVRSNQLFDAMIEPQAPIDPRLDLGADPRECAVLHGDRAASPAIAYGDVLEQLTGLWFDVDTPKPSWKVTKRDDNPANVAIKYW